MPNSNGLVALNNRIYRVSPTSGPFHLWDAGDGPTGAVKGYACKAWITDVAAEPADLLRKQRPS